MDNIGALIVPAVIALVAISIVAKGVRVVQQAQTMIIERLGRYHRTLSSGVNLIIPIIDKPRAIDWHQVIVTPAGDSFARHFRSEEHTSELQSHSDLVCRLLLEKKNKNKITSTEIVYKLSNSTE